MRASAARVRELLAGWTDARQSVEGRRRDLALLDADLISAREKWVMTMERTYGRLVERLGRTRARRFFPKKRQGKKAKTPE
ncbi:MAG: hypothetical protein HY791_13575 [Deltaproteobacteria bacterium]|nr:hypothetical protein [Deltaproteobacteria bacterium]